MQRQVTINRKLAVDILSELGEYMDECLEIAGQVLSEEERFNYNHKAKYVEGLMLALGDAIPDVPITEGVIRDDEDPPRVAWMEH